MVWFHRIVWAALRVISRIFLVLVVETGASVVVILSNIFVDRSRYRVRRQWHFMSLLRVPRLNVLQRNTDVRHEAVLHRQKLAHLVASR